MHLKELKITLGQQDGSGGKGSCCPAYQPEFDPRIFLVEGENVHAQVVSLLHKEQWHVCTCEHVHALLHTHTHARYMNI